MTTRTIGSDEARTRLPEVLDLASHGTPTVVTRRGRPVAAIVPVDALPARERRTRILALRGSGAGLWDDDPAQTIADMRDEWT